ncbi:MAG: protein kinase [Gammaproteobacteria bacterium]|nr:protein kinase [Gammaproteobacteria bacterium]
MPIKYKEKRKAKNPKIEKFDFQPGKLLVKKYEVIARLGSGWEGEVYHIREVRTGIERAAKFFFPHRNLRDRTSITYAKKLHKLRHCPILIQYHTQESIIYHREAVNFLVSDFVEGEILPDYINRQPGKRLHYFQGMHLLHALASGIECVHNLKDYHGDLHGDNIIVRDYGIGYDIKLLDMFHWGSCKPENIYGDVVNLIHLFYNAIGGKKHYSKHPQQVKSICCGLKTSLILDKFRSAGQLREYLETIEW